MLNLDTHILVKALAGALKPRETQLLASDAWGISGIVLWEITMLSAHRRIALDIGSAKFRRAIASIQVWPIDLEVCQRLGELDFKSDPADEIIAATSLAHSAPLLTRDSKILASSVVPLALSNQGS